MPGAGTSERWCSTDGPMPRLEGSTRLAVCVESRIRPAPGRQGLSMGSGRLPQLAFAHRRILADRPKSVIPLR